VSALVKTVLGVGGKKTLLDRLETGWKGLGGKTPEGRMLATQLLSSLGWITDAAPFLPLKSEEWADADTMQLVFTMEHFTQTGIAQRDERQLQRAAEVCAYLMKNSRFGNYTSVAGPLIAAQGGRVLARGDVADVVEGAVPGRPYLIEFPSYAAAQACFNSAGYQQAIALRADVAKFQIVIVEGFVPPASSPR
jgi:uncharacterized protein (DUF1330 family)